MEKTFVLAHGELKISCKLSEPDCGELRRVVLGVHGLGGSTDDAIQAGIAEEMGLFYSATIRFDFPAHGDSPMDSGAFTLKNCVNTLLAVARNAKERYPQVQDLCIFATGFGAYVTLIALQQLQQLPGQIKAGGADTLGADASDSSGDEADLPGDAAGDGPDHLPDQTASGGELQLLQGA